MAQSRFIQSVLDAAREEAGASGVKSINWFRGKIEAFGKPGPQQLLRDGRRTKGVNFGTLNMFVYSPKHRNTLPYYDTFPLVLPIGGAAGGSSGGSAGVEGMLTCCCCNCWMIRRGCGHDNILLLLLQLLMLVPLLLRTMLLAATTAACVVACARATDSILITARSFSSNLTRTLSTHRSRANYQHGWANAHANEPKVRNSIYN